MLFSMECNLQIQSPKNEAGLHSFSYSSYLFTYIIFWNFKTFPQLTLAKLCTIHIKSYGTIYSTIIYAIERQIRPVDQKDSHNFSNCLGLYCIVYDCKLWCNHYGGLIHYWHHQVMWWRTNQSTCEQDRVYKIACSFNFIMK